MNKRGARSKEIGDSAEAHYEAYHFELMRAGLAYVEHSQPKFVYAGRGSWRPQQKGPFDYFGVAWTGRPLFFELKHREAGAQFTWKPEDDHQLIALRRMEYVTQGMALNFVLVEWQWKGQVEARIHWIGDIPERIVRREPSILVPNRRWYDALEPHLNVPEDVEQHYFAAKELDSTKHLDKLWQEGALF